MSPMKEQIDYKTREILAAALVAAEIAIDNSDWDEDFKKKQKEKIQAADEAVLRLFVNGVKA
jgi:hypothetical protein